MLYLLDANVLIDANRDYYPLDRVPEFWDWRCSPAWTPISPDLSDEEVERVGRDPFLIAYALGDRTRRTVVTTEVSKPTKQRANRHIPDVCDGLGVLYCNTYEFIRALDFTTGGAR